MFQESYRAIVSPVRETPGKSADSELIKTIL